MFDWLLKRIEQAHAVFQEFLLDWTFILNPPATAAEIRAIADFNQAARVGSREAQRDQNWVMSGGDEDWVIIEGFKRRVGREEL